MHLTMISRNVIPSFEGAFFRIAPVAFKKEFNPSRRHNLHEESVYLAKKASLFSQLLFLHLMFCYTLRRFGGLHPLCGTGVTSRIIVIVSPASCNDRNADSLPAPGPFI